MAKLKQSSILRAALFAALTVLALAGCQSDNVVATGNTQFFVQNLNPQYLDVLWVIDDRSPMFRVRDRLVSEAQRFFARLDAAAVTYRMGFISADMAFSRGRLKPDASPAILTKDSGLTVADRSAYFGSILSQIINLHTGAEDRGFEATLAALTQSFGVRTGVPLVVVFISDADDHSVTPAGQPAVDYYESALLALKGGTREQLRVYSINYKALAAGASPTDATRCATLFNADIDKAGFEDRYFELARRFAADQTNRNNATADLCGSFADQINLNGLRLRELPKRFLLGSRPNLATLTVSVIVNSAEISAPYTYDSATNEIVFTTAPPEGATIRVSYQTQ